MKHFFDVYFHVWIKIHLLKKSGQNRRFSGQYEIIWENQKINSDFDKKSRVGGVGSGRVVVVGSSSSGRRTLFPSTYSQDL